MTIDFRKEAQPPANATHDPLTQMIREGVSTRSGRSSVDIAFDKLTGQVPLGADAPTKTSRKVIAGSWELLAALKYGVISLFFLVVGAGICFAATHGEVDLKLLAFAAGSLALSALSGRWALVSARNVRSIASA